MFSRKIVHAGWSPAVCRSSYPPIVIMFSLETFRCEPVGPAGMKRQVRDHVGKVGPAATVCPKRSARPWAPCAIHKIILKVENNAHND